MFLRWSEYICVICNYSKYKPFNYNELYKIMYRQLDLDHLIYNLNVLQSGLIMLKIHISQIYF